MRLRPFKFFFGHFCLLTLFQINIKLQYIATSPGDFHESPPGIYFKPSRIIAGKHAKSQEGQENRPTLPAAFRAASKGERRTT
jgi:hypothetical protein